MYIATLPPLEVVGAAGGGGGGIDREGGRKGEQEVSYSWLLG